MHGLPVDGTLDPDLLARIGSSAPGTGRYTITGADTEDLSPPIPSDYAAMAKRDHLGYTSVAEELAERFHMDIDLLEALNPGAAFSPGETVLVTDPGPNATTRVSRIEADKSVGQVRGYDAAGALVVAYPATIGSTATPSPSGTHRVDVVVHMPNYTYNPDVNFQQGGNDEKLIIPPGPNGPVGSIWIDLTEPTFGIHGTPDPELIGKTATHGCVRLTNWDAAERADLVDKGVPVTFLD
jgi:lipoprotein-anchoring transpeptidase ErfK/SrfK